jgi:hypothetical protein
MRRACWGLHKPEKGRQAASPFFVVNFFLNSILIISSYHLFSPSATSFHPENQIANQFELLKIVGRDEKIDSAAFFGI